MAAAAAIEVKILGSWSSPYVMRPRIALSLKNIDYQFLPEVYGSKSELLLKSNPVHKKIPVIIHKDRPISESLIIVQYIDEAFPASPSILPSDPYDRAMARFWASYIDDKWFELVKEVGKAITEEEKEKTIEGLNEGMGILEDTFQKLSQGKEFFGGDTIGYVDIAIGSCLGWLKVVGMRNGCKFIDETKTPGLYGWAERFCSHDAVKSLMPETEKLLEHAKMAIARAISASK